MPPRNRLEQARFANPIGAHYGGDLTRFGREGHIVQDLALPIFQG